MAVVLMEGFDHLSATQVTIKGWTATASVQTGRFSGQAMRIANGVSTVKNLPTTYTTLWMGFAFKVGTVSSINNIVQAQTTAGARIVAFASDVSGHIIILNAAGTVVGTSALTLVANNWYYGEMKIVRDASTGSVNMRVNGASTDELTLTSLNLGATDIGRIALQGGPSNCDFDDVYVLDGTGSAPTKDFLGDVRVETLAPTGNGANTAWTGAFGDWDDSTSHDTDTTFVSSATPGDRETSTLSDLSVGTGTVYAVQTNLIARKDDAGTRTIAPVIRIGSTNYDGTTTAGLTASYLDYTQIYDRLDPSTATWSISTVNGMEAGVKEVA